MPIPYPVQEFLLAHMTTTLSSRHGSLSGNYHHRSSILNVVRIAHGSC